MIQVDAARRGPRRRRLGQDLARGGEGPPARRGRPAGRAALLQPRARRLPPAAGRAARSRGSGRRTSARSTGSASTGSGRPRGATTTVAYWEERLPAAMAALAAERPVASASTRSSSTRRQDFAESWWPALLASLRDPESGGLYVFADEGQRIFARQGRPPVALIPISLDENLRNTKQIAQTFGSLSTAARCGTAEATAYPVRFVACSADEAVARGERRGRRAARRRLGARARRAADHRQPAPGAGRAAGCGPDAYWESFWAGDDLFYGHVLGFKGLERPAVVLAVNGFRDGPRPRDALRRPVAGPRPAGGLRRPRRDRRGWRNCRRAPTRARRGRMST